MLRCHVDHRARITVFHPRASALATGLKQLYQGGVSVELHAVCGEGVYRNVLGDQLKGAKCGGGVIGEQQVAVVVAHMSSVTRMERRLNRLDGTLVNRNEF